MWNNDHGGQMPLEATNHFVFTGSAIEGVVDLGGVSGDASAAVTVDGDQLAAPVVDVTALGIVVQAILEQVPDERTVTVVVTIPAANLPSGSTSVTSAGFAVLVTVCTSVGGPGLVPGPLQRFELRPLAVTASAVESAAS
jgi:hypothetical protein